MRLPITVLAALFATAASAQTPAPAATEPANVTVKFTKPESFADATYENRQRSRKQVNDDLSKAFAELGKRYLPPGQKLEIEVTDIDLAGRYEPWQIDHPDTRFMRDVTWPRIKLKYRLLDGEREIAKGEDQLTDMNYLSRAGFGKSGDRLKYEKAMLDDWFRGRFAAERTKAAGTS